MFSFRFDCGVSQPASTVTLASRGTIIASITLHYTIYSCKTELDEIRRGLSAVNFLDLMSAHPILRSLFIYTPQELTVEVIQDLFVPTYSPQGSNSRNIEEAIVMLFMELLFEMASKYKPCMNGSAHSFAIYLYIPLADGKVSVVEDGEKKDIPLSLADMLVFTTDASAIPPMGFDIPPSIKFKKEGSDLPCSSTCTNTLYIPTKHSSDYETFKYKFVFALTGAIGFGQV